jgi:hypothetical protein
MTILQQLAKALEAVEVEGEVCEIIHNSWHFEDWQGVLIIQTSLAEWHIEPPDWRCPTWTASRYPGCGWHGPTGHFLISVAKEDDPISIAAGVQTIIAMVEGSRA